MGITGATYRLGLHGQGGIGKSVLAAALARDDKVRRAFPDGVYWVGLGQSPDLLRLQADVLSAVEGRPGAVVTVEEGSRVLSERLRSRACLLVLDDVWDMRHARAFDVLGPRSRLLVTTRDGAVLTALGAREERIERLPEAVALELLAGWAGQEAARLPDAAHRVARECGCLPLALAVAGARVRDGVTWDDLSAVLERGRVEFLDHPYANVFRSMRLSVDALPENERRRYLELAVFPEEEGIPEPVVTQLWARTGGLEPLEARALLRALERKALLEVKEEGTFRKAFLHDLQHDFLRILIEDLPNLHVSLIEAIAAWEPSRRTPDEADPYIWLHLPAHLVAAGREAELRQLLLDYRWLYGKLRATGVSALLSDFDLFPADPDLVMVSAALRLSAHVLAQRPSQLPSQLLGRLLDVDRPAVRALLERAKPATPRVWIRPMTASLTAPARGLLRTLTGHRRQITAIVIPPDGRHIVSGAEDGLVRRWDLETGELIHTYGIERHSQGWWREVVAITPDAKRVVLTDNSLSMLEVQDLETGRRIGVQRVRLGFRNLAAITPDGRRVVAVAENGTLNTWDIEADQLRPLYRSHREVTALAVTSDGRRAALGLHDGTLVVTDLETGKQGRRRKGHGSQVSALLFTQDGRKVISAELGGSLQIWNLHSLLPRRTLKLFGASFLTLVDNERRLIAGTYAGTVVVYDLKGGKIFRLPRGHSRAVSAAAVTPDGQWIVSGAGDGTLKVWDLDEATSLDHEERFSRVKIVAVAPNGRRAFSESENALKVWDLERCAQMESIRLPSSFEVVAMTPDARCAVLDRILGGGTVWDTQTHRTLCRLVPGSLAGWVPLARLTWVPSWMMEWLIRLDGWIGGNRLDTGFSEFAAAVTPDGRRVVTLKREVLRVWDVNRCESVRTLEVGRAPNDAVAITPDGQWVLFTTLYGKVFLWNAETGEQRTLEDDIFTRAAPAPAPDARHAITDHRGELYVWNLETGERVHKFAGRTAELEAIAVSSDGRLVVSGSKQGVKVWDFASGKMLTSFMTDAPVLSCAAAPDGRMLVAGDGLGNVHLLRVEGLEEGLRKLRRRE
ncbi:MAG TPA: NB-ARC domain-containing protein [Longimicrobium sp.]|nr:NB-ARC domain-containing protein [Longimicrobium sp.]